MVEPTVGAYRLRHMTRLARPLVVGPLVAVVLAACSAGSMAPASPPASSPPVTGASPSTGASSGGGSGGGGGAVTPVPVQSGRPSIPAPSPIVVAPVAGLYNVRDIRATAVTLAASGGHLTASVFWWSGPAPCSVLAEVAVDRASDGIHLTVREGAQQLGVACPALAVYKTTTVDLGPATPGSTTVWALGVDQPATLVVAG